MTAILPDKDDIMRTLAALLGPDDVVELRAFPRSGRKRTVSGYFDSRHWQQLAEHAERWSRAGAAVYVTLNPVDPQLMSRCANTVNDDAKATTTDKQITRRRWLLVDVDPKRPTDTSADESQVEEAHMMILAIRDYLTSQGWPAPVLAHSGNGYHLLYAIDLPNDSEATELVKSVLQKLAARFDNAVAQVDTSVFNAARISKLYGTIANKGRHCEQYPHRVARLLTVPERMEVTQEQLRALAGTAAPESQHRPAPAATAPTQGQFSLEDFFSRHGITYSRDMHEGSERFKLDACPFNSEHGKGEAAIFRRPTGALGFKCMHDSCGDKRWQDVRELFEGPRPQHEQWQFTPTAYSTQEAPQDAPEGPSLVPVSVSDVLTRPDPPPRYVWSGYVPRGVVTLFGAHGGTGKSTIALMLAAATAMGRPLFNIDTERCSVVFVSLEDGAGIVRNRLAGICEKWNIDPQELAGRLHIVDGTENPELFSAEARGPGELTLVYHKLRKLVQSVGAGLVIVDNASDAFGGDEIQRRQVRTFIRSLGAIAKANNAAMLLLAHVDKNTSRAGKAEGGEGYSGSTAWHNGARSRIFMTRNDSGMLLIEHQKNNLGKMREPLLLAWPKNGLPQVVDELPEEVINKLQGRADDTTAIAILRLIAEFEGRGHYCGTAMTARNNPHAVLRSEPAFRALKLGRDDTRRIINQCQRAGWLEIIEYRTVDRKMRDRWTVTPAGRDFAGIAPSAPSCTEAEESAERAGGAPSAPSCVGGMGESARAREGADLTSTA